MSRRRTIFSYFHLRRKLKQKKKQQGLDAIFLANWEDGNSKKDKLKTDSICFPSVLVNFSLLTTNIAVCNQLVMLYIRGRFHFTSFDIIS